MALTNLKKNSNVYIPYILTCIFTIITFYIMNAIARNEGLNSMPGSASLCSILWLGTIVIGIFSAIFLFYTNSFLIKRRKKELGLYNILGMEKKHIAKVLFFESIIVSLLCLIVGVLGGILFSKLLFLLLLYMLNFDVSIQFSVSFPALVNSMVLFLGIFFFTLLANLWQVKWTNAIALLHGGKIGEREPKTKWILTMIGVLCLGGGYFIAQTVESPLAALYLFFIAVLLVIVGTYCLFTAGSIALLKILRKNKRFYYKSKNFISISGMIYRMKQNAVGLANICILSTMVLVILSTTISLYIGKEDLLHSRYPRDIIIEYKANDVEKDLLHKIIKEQVSKFDVSIEQEMTYRESGFIANLNDNKFKPADTNSYMEQNAALLCIIPLDDYNRLEGKQERLADNETLLFSVGKELSNEVIQVNDYTFQVKKKLETIDFMGNNLTALIDTYYMVVNDIDFVANMKNVRESRYYTAFNVKGDKEEIIEFAKQLETEVRTNITGLNLYDSMHLADQEFYSVYGGFLFLGLFLGALFMMATVLIIYYKQISEGYDDHDRFQIMQKVGLSKKEVKSTIRRQIVMVFFLPLAGAVVHICFAFKVISKLLVLFSMTNTNLYMLCTLCTVLIFGIMYGIVYGWTARVYYKIVEA